MQRLVCVLVILLGIWTAYATDSRKWLAGTIVLSALMIGFVVGIFALVASKAREPEPCGSETERERQLRQKAELSGSLAPRGMGPYVNPKPRRRRKENADS